MPHSFNLVTEPWIPVRPRQPSPGRPVVRIGLREALLNGAAYVDIVDDAPLVVAGLHRLLLGILHRAMEGPCSTAHVRAIDTVATWWQNGFDRQRVEAYLERWHGSFDLFDTERPFMQVPHLDNEKWLDAWTRLSADRGNGNTNFLFNRQLRHEGSAPPGALTPAEAACLLVAHQQFVLGGLIKRIITSAPAAPSASYAVFLAEGETLHETLCLNLAPYDRHVGDDKAWWESDRWPLSQTWLEQDQTAPILGRVHAWTWPSRAIRLLPDADGNVATMMYAAGVRQIADDDLSMRDATTALRKKVADDTYVPIRVDPDRALWRSAHAFLPTGQAGHTKTAEVLDHAQQLHNAVCPDRPLRIRVIGQSNDKSKLAMVMDDRYVISPQLSADDECYGYLTTAIERIDEIGLALQRATRTLVTRMLSDGDRDPAAEDVKNLVENIGIVRAYWTSMDRVFTDFMAGLAGPDDVVSVVERAIAVAQTEWDRTTDSLGRETRTIRAIALADSRFRASLFAITTSLTETTS